MPLAITMQITQKFEEQDFQYSKIINPFSKEIGQVTDQWVKCWHTSVLFYFSLSYKQKYQLMFMSGILSVGTQFLCRYKSSAKISKHILWELICCVELIMK